jgi:thiol:disulfide interchange protein
LCQKGFRALSWFLVLLPYIFIALAMFGMYRMSHSQNQMMKTVKLQGAYGQ